MTLGNGVNAVNTMDLMPTFISEQLSGFVNGNNLQLIYSYIDKGPWSIIVICYGDCENYFFIEYDLGFTYFMGNYTRMLVGFGKRKFLKERRLKKDSYSIGSLKGGLCFSKLYDIEFDFENDRPIVKEACLEIPHLYDELKKVMKTCQENTN